MTRVNFICHNGEFINSLEYFLNHKNRAFQFGDGLFETMHARNTTVQFLDDHYDRLMSGIELLRMTIPVNFSKEILQEKITRLLNANKTFGGARIRLTIYRREGGRYIPENDEFDYLLVSTSLDHEEYIMNDKGLVIDLYPYIPKPINILSNIKSINAQLFVLAGHYKKTKLLDDCIILNDQDNVTECISSNIFLVKKNKLFTPSLSEGCVAGIMRKQVLIAAKTMNLEVYDNGFLKLEDLLLADEIFLSNAIAGIKWVVGYKRKRYFNKTAMEILENINNMAFEY